MNCIEIAVLESRLQEAARALERLLQPPPEEWASIYDQCGKLRPHVRADYEYWRRIKSDLEEELKRVSSA